eukprot:CAMPEP_0172721368 /NCGR_PEP_ID=MMETSP1074-20121228/78970_1 /TAXON_ID=2916 /ORGANISM="Ceratium fusus, Strain PA161109" /LENGTH=250 /DNA_ID=CAMNT_0013547097 /DNA_START=59 /DNA_END=812 /DNA_ORIENTATION=+
MANQQPVVPTRSLMADGLRRLKRTFTMQTNRKRSVPVTLHVYSVGQSTSMDTVNGLLRLFGTGAYHAAVEVYGAEWSYGYTPEGSGVFECRPGACEMHIYREKVNLGKITHSREEVLRILEEMQGQYPGADYDLLRKNCCTFSEDFAKRLGLEEAFPSWVSNLASTGAKAVDIVGEERMAQLGDKAFAAADKVVEAIELGGQERTGTPNAGYKFGDLTRGLIVVGGKEQGDQDVALDSACATAFEGFEEA